MNVFSILLCFFTLFSWSTLVTGQGFRCTPGSMSSLCVTRDPTPAPIPAAPRLVNVVTGNQTAAASIVMSDDVPLCSPLYRTLDGTCTNLAMPFAGAAGTAHFSYFDTSSVEPNGANRPSARLVSNIVSEQGDVDTPNSRGITLFFVFFGQFLDHDLVLTPTNTSEPFNISIPKGDPIFSNLSSRAYTYNVYGSSPSAVLPFSRSVRARTSASNPSAMRPVNVNSSPIDLSLVYGSDEERFDALRAEGSCRLRTFLGRYLPLNFARLENEPTDSAKFFLAGDLRPNENPALTSIHTIFVREHNKLCGELERAFPLESAGKLFELARKVNIFQMQRIVYEEFLPAITGRRLRLGPFNPSVSPAVSDIFSTAAFRLGHTMVNDILPTGSRSTPFLSAEDMFFRNALTFRLISRPGRYLNAAARTVAQEVDVKVVDALRNFLFSDIEELTGFDLIALNLQRGRDHALPSYNTVRRFFKLPELTKFSQVTSDIRVQFRLRSVYRKVDDMDLWVALLAEDHVPGASMGETMLAVWEEEFRRLAEGDRFFYTTPGLFDDDFKNSFRRFSKIESSETLMRDILVRNSPSSINFPESLFRQPRQN